MPTARPCGPAADVRRSADCRPESGGAEGDQDPGLDDLHPGRLPRSSSTGERSQRWTSGRTSPTRSPSAVRPRRSPRSTPARTTSRSRLIRPDERPAEVVATYLVETYLPLEQAAESSPANSPRARSCASPARLRRAPRTVRRPRRLHRGAPAHRATAAARAPSGRPVPDAAARGCGSRSGSTTSARRCRTCSRPWPATSSSSGSSPASGCSTSTCRPRSPSAIPARSSASRGTRDCSSRPDGVLIGTIVKPSIGLPPDELRARRPRARRGGHRLHQGRRAAWATRRTAPLARAGRRGHRGLDKVADAHRPTGRCTRSTSPTTSTACAANHDLVVEAGGTCVMVCVNLVGLAAVSHGLREHCALPIHGHRAMSGAITRAPQLGIGFVAWSEARPAGRASITCTPTAVSNKFYETDEEVLASIAASASRFLGGYATLPVLSSGQWAGAGARRPTRRPARPICWCSPAAASTATPTAQAPASPPCAPPGPAPSRGDDARGLRRTKSPALRRALETFGSPYAGAEAARCMVGGFYGDDFTGSTDALVQFARAGLRAVLLVDLPRHRELRELAARYDVVGVAGIARSLLADGDRGGRDRPCWRRSGATWAARACSTRCAPPPTPRPSSAASAARSRSAARSSAPRRSPCSQPNRSSAATPSSATTSPPRPARSTASTAAHHVDSPLHPDARIRPPRPPRPPNHLRLQPIDLTMYADLPATYARCADLDVLVLDALADEHLHRAGQAILTTKRPAFAIGLGRPVPSFRPEPRSPGPLNLRVRGQTSAPPRSWWCRAVSPHGQQSRSPERPRRAGQCWT